MVDESEELLAVFREESATRLDRMVETLLALEASRPPPDAINLLFRDAHSIKGAAGMLGLPAARTIAHAIEDALQDARDRATFATDLADPLLRATDSLRSVIFDGAEVDDAAVAGLVAATRRADDQGRALNGVPDDRDVESRNGGHAERTDVRALNGGSLRGGSAAAHARRGRGSLRGGSAAAHARAIDPDIRRDGRPAARRGR